MARWSDVAAAEPEFAARVEARFTAGKHCTMATLRSDGAPRISGTEIIFRGGELEIGSMAGSVKARDLLRDGRLALHCPTEDAPEDNPSGWSGDAKIAGRAVEVIDPAPEDGSHLFRIDVTEVVHTSVGTPADHLVIEAWHPDRGLERHKRT